MGNTHYINLVKSDFFEQLWSALPFVPIVIFYSHTLLYLNTIIERLQNWEFLQQINIFAGYGLSTLILILVEEAAKKSENDFIAGPLHTLNIYSFFYIGLLLGNWQLAFIGVGFYLVISSINLPKLGETSISKNEWIKLEQVGMTRKYFVLKHYVFEPLANFISMAFAYWVIQKIIPVAAWINADIISQIKFLSLQIALWKASYEILYAIYFWVIPIRNISETFKAFLIVAFPPSLLFWTVNKITITIYILAYAFAWLALGIFISERIKEGGNMQVGKNVRGYKQ